MLGASARYSCFCTPVETSTPPRRRKVHSAQDALPGILYSIPLRLLSAQKPLRWVLSGLGTGNNCDRIKNNPLSHSNPLVPGSALGERRLCRKGREWDLLFQGWPAAGTAGHGETN